MPQRALKRDARLRRVNSVATCLIFVLLAIAYLYPDEFVRNPIVAKRSNAKSVTMFIESLTVIPVWSLIFLVAALFIVIGLLPAMRLRTKQFIPSRLLPSAHLAAFVTLVGYFTALITTAYINPGTYITTAGFVFLIAVNQVTLMLGYSSRTDVCTTGRTARRRRG